MTDDPHTPPPTAPETVPRADHDRLLAELEAVKTAHAEAIAALQGAEAEKGKALARVQAWEGQMAEMVLAPVVGRLVHPSVRAQLPKPSFDAETGAVLPEWQTQIDAWMTEHGPLLKPATPATVNGQHAPRTSTPPSKGGSPVKTREYWLDMMKTDDAQFRRRYHEYQADKAAGGW